MANFKQGYVLTNAGKELQAKVEAGETRLKVTKMALGSGTVESIDDYAELTDLVNEEYELMVSSVEAQDVSCVVKGKINSQTVAEGFDVTELGLFAMDGENEILYCVAYDEDAMYVPGKSDGSAVECEFSIYIQFATADKIEIVLPTNVDEIVKWVQNNALTCETAAEKAEKAIDAADRAEQEALNAGNAAAMAESAKEDAVAARDRTEAVAIEVKEATTAAKTSEENAKASETAAAESAELAKTRVDSIKGDVEKAAASASEAAISETNAEESALKAEAAAQKLTNVFVYKGTVATYAELPTDPETGDVWNVQKADKTHGIKAGDNVAWSGTDWDSLGGTCDLSEYALTADQQKDVVNASVNGATVTLIARDGTNTPLTVNDVAHATAADSATNDSDGNAINTTYLKAANVGEISSDDITAICDVLES